MYTPLFFFTSHQTQQQVENGKPAETSSVIPVAHEQLNTETTETTATNHTASITQRDTPPSVSPVEGETKTSAKNLNGVCIDLIEIPKREETDMSITLNKTDGNINMNTEKNNEAQKSVTTDANEEEKAPIPPPRRKRKKKKMQKPPSLENLIDVSMNTYR